MWRWFQPCRGLADSMLVQPARECSFHGSVVRRQERCVARLNMFFVYIAASQGKQARTGLRRWIRLAVRRALLVISNRSWIRAWSGRVGIFIAEPWLA